MPSPLTFTPAQLQSAAALLATQWGENADLRLNVYGKSIATEPWQRWLVGVFDKYLRSEETIAAEKAAILQAFLDIAPPLPNEANSLPAPGSAVSTDPKQPQRLVRSLTSRDIRQRFAPTLGLPGKSPATAPATSTSQPAATKAIPEPEIAGTAPAPTAEGTNVSVLPAMASPSPAHLPGNGLAATTDAPCVPSPQQPAAPIAESGTPVANDDAPVQRGAAWFRALTARLAQGPLSPDDGRLAARTLATGLAEHFRATGGHGDADRMAFFRQCLTHFEASAAPEAFTRLKAWLQTPDAETMLAGALSPHENVDITPMQRGAACFQAFADRLAQGPLSPEDSRLAARELAAGLAEHFRASGTPGDAERAAFFRRCLLHFRASAAPNTFAHLEAWMRTPEAEAVLAGAASPSEDDKVTPGQHGAGLFRTFVNSLAQGPLAQDQSRLAMMTLASNLAICFQADGAQDTPARMTFVQQCFDDFAIGAAEALTTLGNWRRDPDTETMLSELVASLEAADAEDIADALSCVLTILQTAVLTDVSPSVGSAEALLQHGAELFQTLATRIALRTPSASEGRLAMMTLVTGLAQCFEIADVQDLETREDFVEQCFDRFTASTAPAAFNAFAHWLRAPGTDAMLDELLESLADTEATEIAGALAIVLNMLRPIDETGDSDDAPEPSIDAPSETALFEARLQAAAYGGKALGAATLPELIADACAALTEQVEDALAYEDDAFTRLLLSDYPGDLAAHPERSTALSSAIKNALRDYYDDLPADRIPTPDDIRRIGTAAAQQFITADINRRRYADFLWSHPLDDALREANDFPGALPPDEATLEELRRIEQIHVENSEELLAEGALVAMRQGLINGMRWRF